MDNLAVVNTQGGTQGVNQDGSVVQVVPSPQIIFGVLPFPIEVHGGAQLLCFGKRAAPGARQDEFAVGIGDFTVLAQGLGERQSNS